MQKLMTISLLSLYVLVSVGVQGVTHFCGQEFVGIAWFESEEEMDCGEMSCCSAPEPVDDDCCSDVEFSVFYESERALTLTISHLELKAPAEVVLPFSILLMEDVPEANQPSDLYHDPGAPPSAPIYLQNSSLIFYG